MGACADFGHPTTTRCMGKYLVAPRRARRSHLWHDRAHGEDSGQWLAQHEHLSPLPYDCGLVQWHQKIRKFTAMAAAVRSVYTHEGIGKTICMAHKIQTDGRVR